MKGGKQQKQQKQQQQQQQQQQQSNKNPMYGGECSAHSYGEQAFGGINNQHAVANGGNMIAMKQVPTLTGGRKSKKTIFGKMRKLSMKVFKMKSMGKSRRNRSSRRR